MGTPMTLVSCGRSSQLCCSLHRSKHLHLAGDISSLLRQNRHPLAQNCRHGGGQEPLQKPRHLGVPGRLLCPGQLIRIYRDLFVHLPEGDDARANVSPRTHHYDRGRCLNPFPLHQVWRSLPSDFSPSLITFVALSSLPF